MITIQQIYFKERQYHFEAFIIIDGRLVIMKQARIKQELRRLLRNLLVLNLFQKLHRRVLRNNLFLNLKYKLFNFKCNLYITPTNKNYNVECKRNYLIQNLT